MMKTPRQTKPAINPVEETKPTLKLVDLVEIGSDGTSIGKSTLANRVCHLYREVGRPVTFVRIESGRRRGQDAGAADTDIFIPLEDFTTAAARNGGLVGVLPPLRGDHADPADWPRGDRRLARGDRCAQAGGARRNELRRDTCPDGRPGHVDRHDELLRRAHEAGGTISEGPGEGRSKPSPLARIERPQRSIRLAGGSEQAEAFARLKAAAGAIPQLTIPLVAGRALQVCTDAGLDIASALMLASDKLATQLGLHVFAATACASELAVWWQRTGAELRTMLEVKHADASVPA